MGNPLLPTHDKSHDAICDFYPGLPVTRASCDERVLALIIDLRCLALFAETREDITSLFYLGNGRQPLLQLRTLWRL